RHLLVMSCNRIILLFCFSSVRVPQPPSSTLFPYTTLFRSRHAGGGHFDERRRRGASRGRRDDLHDRRHRDGCADAGRPARRPERSEEHTSELQSRGHLVCRLLLEKKKMKACSRTTAETTAR